MTSAKVVVKEPRLASMQIAEINVVERLNGSMVHGNETKIEFRSGQRKAQLSPRRRGKSRDRRIQPWIEPLLENAVRIGAVPMLPDVRLRIYSIGPHSEKSIRQNGEEDFLRGALPETMLVAIDESADQKGA